MKKPIPPLPRRVWVGSYEFSMRLVDPTDKMLLDCKGVASSGMSTFDHDGEGYGIWVSEMMALRTRLEIVMHEITHAINFAYDVKNRSAEETIAEKHGHAWSQFWLDNPRFERWFVYTLAAIRKERRVDDPPTTESK